MINRNDEFRAQQHRKRIAGKIQGSNAMQFYNALTGRQLLEKVDALLPEHRERLYPPTVTLSMFISQALNEDGSCQQAVNDWAMRRALEGLKTQSVDTGAYCRARQRLPIQLVQQLVRETGRLLNGCALPVWKWYGRTVKLVDGSGLSMPDTEANQRQFPQSSNQRKGVGFPLARTTAVICLSTGAVMDAALGPFTGEGNSEMDQFRSLIGALKEGDVMLGDSLYCSYFLIAALQAMGVDCLFELHPSRDKGFREGSRLGPRDRLVRWPKTRLRPKWMSLEYYKGFTRQITVRIFEVDGRMFVTTLCDAKKYPKQELGRLYTMRWHVELDLRNLKSTLGMDVLSCNTPEMNEKEFWVYLLGYNLIRLFMAQAAQNASLHPRQISFKHTVQLWLKWSGCIKYQQVVSAEYLFSLIAQNRVGDRPGRIEPRARKRRPKSYPWLRVPRAETRRRIMRKQKYRAA